MHHGHIRGKVGLTDEHCRISRRSQSAIMCEANDTQVGERDVGGHEYKTPVVRMLCFSPVVDASFRLLQLIYTLHDWKHGCFSLSSISKADHPLP